MLTQRFGLLAMAALTLSQQKTYLFNDIQERLGKHMANLQMHPPKQKSGSLSIGN